MEEVTGIGGLFLRLRPNALALWYRGHLGIDQAWMINFTRFRDPEGTPIELWQPA